MAGIRAALVDWACTVQEGAVRRQSSLWGKWSEAMQDPMERIQGSQEIRDRKSRIVTPRNCWGANARATTGNVSEAMQPEQEGDACCRCELCMCRGPG